MFFFALIIVGALIAIVASLVVGNRKNIDKRASTNHAKNDVPKPIAMSDEERDAYNEVASFVGHADITQEDIKAYQIHGITEDFAAAPGGDFWDASIHQAPGQYDRLKRGAKQPPTLVAYDQERMFANLRGSSGNHYLTSPRRCSCPDYRARHLPCKHMYWLVVELADPSGLINHHLWESENPLFGFTFATAGRFPGKSKDEFAKQMLLRGAHLDTNLSRESTALICADGKSEVKIHRAGELDMEILSPDEALNLFH